MRKTYKYRLLGNNLSFAKAKNWLYLCRWLYNCALEQRISIYEQDKGYITHYDQMNQLPELKQYFPEYKTVSAQTLQHVIERLDKAYKGFFLRIKRGNVKAGFPRFKGKNRFDSFTLKQTGWKLNGKYLTLSKIGKFKIRLSRPIEGTIKQITIHREHTEKWYVLFHCDNVPERKFSKTNQVVGIDVGIKSLLVDSEGNKTDNPQYLRKAEDLLRIRQRAVARKRKRSNRKTRAKILVSKSHEKIRNQRRDYLHKIANFYINNFGTIVIEKLNIEGMTKNRHLSKSINDSGWGIFYKYLDYKAVEAGRQIIRVPLFEPTSKTCSNCGDINQDLTLNDRQWVCKSCGVLHDRDYNAAKNIKRVGQTQQALTCANRQSVACESTRLTKSGVSTTEVGRVI